MLSALQVGASLFALNIGCMNHDRLCSLSRSDLVPHCGKRLQRAEAFPSSICILPSKASLLLYTWMVMPRAAGREGTG